MKKWVDDKTGITFSEPDAVDEFLELIWAIGADYDGCNTVESLKALIDELVNMASDARVALRENKLFGENSR